jgi:hypothetical protein
LVCFYPLFLLLLLVPLSSGALHLQPRCHVLGRQFADAAVVVVSSLDGGKRGWARDSHALNEKLVRAVAAPARGRRLAPAPTTD